MRARYRILLYLCSSPKFVLPHLYNNMEPDLPAPIPSDRGGLRGVPVSGHPIPPDGQVPDWEGARAKGRAKGSPAALPLSARPGPGRGACSVAGGGLLMVSVPRSIRGEKNQTAGSAESGAQIRILLDSYCMHYYSTSATGNGQFSLIPTYRQYGSIFFLSFVKQLLLSRLTRARLLVAILKADSLPRQRKSRV